MDLEARTRWVELFSRLKIQMLNTQIQLNNHLVVVNADS